MTPPLSSAPSFELPTPTVPPLAFSSASRMLSYVTQNWRTDFVTVDLNTKELLEGFSRRPFFMVVSVDAPLLCRFRRSRNANLSLEEFVEENDQLVYGQGQTPKTGEAPNFSSLDSLRHSVNLHILNAFDTVAALHAHLEEINVVNPERVRPHWDTYFMTLASLASHRSNCMKRRVGAILVRNHRIVATGYNGTPRGVKNCKDGGCPRCNSGAKEADECLCLHAEENALLEAGRERVGEGSVLYCNTCPCLKCTIKIIQTGVKEVVYNLTYKVDDASARLFNEAGVQLRRHAPPS
ncbi:hypothetical protein JAAARDRAFT_119158 [Jaapia argillacea MUCL 33604]|uniref:Deoxycytidylate deaminase n=1 Tax=Jaapia argillacea MUCL 33604 TaxID=933084 RepID=A0A067QKP9_9AGAM|nr:hypothetical protein JAAARDRAFT_119158 [Jaapia argillacea MUCL 33604]